MNDKSGFDPEMSAGSSKNTFSAVTIATGHCHNLMSSAKGGKEEGDIE
jgi:hypothetical protein